VSERPILFSGTMVRAILDGRKTQTRRVITRVVWANPTYDAQTFMDINPVHRANPSGLCPYGDPGDTLWVRETFAKRYADAQRDPADGIIYRADGGLAVEPRWTPAIHMPRWASRLTLRITAVRVQRVQDITAEDAHAEGILRGPTFGDRDIFDRALFAKLWDSINAKRGYSWDSNPWVWALTFERVT
jgi:hypothetical protein